MKTKGFALCFCLFLGCSTISQHRVYETELSKSAAAWVEKTLGNMTLQEKIGQMFFYHLDADFKTNDDSSWQRIKTLVEMHHLGGIHLWRGAPYATAYLTNRLQSFAKIPLLFTADFEHGVARFGGTDFPPNMAIGATGDPQMAYLMGLYTAREARSLGIHLTFAPVADVNNNPVNPIINVRSFGEDPEMVARFSEAFIRGCHEGGLLTTAKHFPGHGDTAEDSHLELAFVPADSARLEQVELVPFRRAIAAGVDFVMTAHLNVRGIAMNPYDPATISPEIMTGLLRQRLGFDGVLITDAMRMWAMSRRYTDAFATAQAVKAGVDAILAQENIPEMIKEMERRVQSGEIAPARIDESVRRLLRAKAKIGLHQQRYVNIDSLAFGLGTAAARETAVSASARAVTLLKNENNLLPLLSADSGNMVVIQWRDEPQAIPFSPFVRELTRYQAITKNFVLTSESKPEALSEILEQLRGARLQIWPIYTPLRAYKGHLGFPENLQPLADSLFATGVPAAAVSFGNPYIFPHVQNAAAYLATFGTTEGLEIAAARALAGAADVSGSLPISIPGYFERGTGLSLKTQEAQPRARVAALPARLRVGFPEEAGMNAARLDSVRHLMRSAVRDSVFPGAVLLAARNGLIVMHEAFGQLGYDDFARPMPLNAIFDLASVTKVVATTTACMLLYEREWLDLDAPVQRYLPAFVGPEKEKVTVRHLLTHSAGLVAYRRYFADNPLPGEMIEKILNEQLENLPGAKTVYSDLGVILLGKIIEKISGQSLEVFCSEQIFSKLNLGETFYNPPPYFLPRIAPTEFDAWRGRVVHGQVHDENAFALGGVSGHAGLFSTARDLAIFLQMLLNGGSYENIQLLKPQTVASFTTRQNLVPGSSRALGWDTADGTNSAGHLMSRRAFGHTGFTGTSVWVDPENNLFVILLSNRVHPTRQNRRLIEFRPKLHDAVMRALEASS